MTRVEEAYALKLEGQILAGSVRASPQEVFDGYSKFISLGGKIVEVAVSEVDDRPCFNPTVYLFYSSSNVFQMGTISPCGQVSEPFQVEHDHPIINIVQKSTGVKKFTYDSIFLIELGSDHQARMVINFSITDSGDTTTVSKMISQKGGIESLIHGFLEKFNF